MAARIDRRTGAVLLAALAGIARVPGTRADEGGASFWVPGQYASFAATPPNPGWSLPITFYTYGGTLDIASTRGRLMAAGLTQQINQLYLQPTYTPAVTVLGATPSLSMTLLPARIGTSADLHLGAISEARSDSVFGLGNFTPTASLFWSAGVHNFMAYATGQAWNGNYDPNRLSNPGLGHAAIDGGAAYSYYNAGSGTEVSATLGFTRNFQNPLSHYTSGIDSHLDAAASQAVTGKFYVGIAGYYYQQLTADQGQLPILGPFESRVRGIGPQIGYNVDLGHGVTLSTGLRGYAEFDAYARTQGFAIFATATLPLSQMLGAH
nr:transporter [uncultured Rhodopila sp.]